VLSPEEHARYARHLCLPEIGESGQMKLKQASVLIIGTGGLSSPAALYLAAAGIGRLGLVDADRVELSNLQRQLLHTDASVGRAKVDSAAERLKQTNPHIALDLHRLRFEPGNAIGIAENYEIILDGSDNFPTRYLASDTAFFLKKPLIYGAIHRFDGQMMVFAPHLGGSCFRCFMPEMPASNAVPTCSEAGVLGVLPSIIGSLMAMEAIKLILGLGTPPLGELLIYDSLQTSFRTLKFSADPSCRLCGKEPSIRSIHNPETLQTPSCSNSNFMQTITAAELKARLDAPSFDALLIDVREVEEWEVIHIPQARLIPLQTIPSQAASLPKDAEIIIHCKAGMRSAKACEYLSTLGFSNVTNVSGGMDEFQKI
jgi:molybdopterin/thiamine biosynthesis adenylyltransferase/rhodanese-related sulfurtransferase